jgi:hypothetical protein
VVCRITARRSAEGSLQQVRGGGPAALLTAVRQLIRTERSGGSVSGQLFAPASFAAQLYLSESSVEKHVNAIFIKLGLSAEQLSHRRVTAVLTFRRNALEPGRPGTWQLSLYRRN